jgi:GT2 family glycosyltransferase
LILTVSYGSGDTVLALVESVSRCTGFPNTHIVILDNASTKESARRISKGIARFTEVSLLESPENQGYLGGAKFAFDHYLSNGTPLPDWIIVCNHDISFDDCDFFVKLFQKDARTVGVIGPRIRVPGTNLDQNPFMKQRPGRWRRFTMRLYSYAYPVAVAWDWLSRQKKALRSRISSHAFHSEENGGTQRIYSPHGSFMIFSRRFFESGGKLDDHLFLFGEEIAIGETCRALGLPVVYDPTLSVLHYEHHSIGNGMSRVAYRHHREAVRYVLSKYLAS